MPLPRTAFRAVSSPILRASLRPIRPPTSTSCLRSRTPLSSTAQCRHYSSQQQDKRPTLASAWKNTKTEWYWIPAGLGVAVVGFVQIRKRTNAAAQERHVEPGEVRPMGAWQVHVMSTLPLKALSYYWGKFNEIPLPVWLRPAGFKLYSFIFGVNLDEVEQPLTEYRNLAEFFYRRLKPGARPIDERHNVVVSPADGKVLQFGEIRSTGQVEQVKGMTYSLDALLGTQQTPNDAAVAHAVLSEDPQATTAARFGPGGDSDKTAAVYSDTHKEFANVNGISYTLPDLLSGPSENTKKQKRSWFFRKSEDASTTPSSTVDDVTVAADLASGQLSSWFAPGDAHQQRRLFFAVIYLAPGDYHRFHSPVPWVVERRRHFAGELYSVSPYLQNRLPGLFTLNERVVLLGRWRHGMYSMTLVGATNVGSIKINFDRELQTNSFVKLAEQEKEMQKEGISFEEATYRGASALLGGQPLTKGAEVGGFNLGSTVVLVFEAPANDGQGEGKGGFRFTVKRGQTVKVGEAIGGVEG
ncbi:phosphatidylserine decarboxylase [Ascodesmis nigricans]|uniref:Phosphatidylserine decarboxylase proenzyme 1, mitochondrial n=1 Tax=Ascodesmis nigricans TaxID=341454 RepID=A0A4S2N2N1_9PEZI|nr:phosphatidylserine decarboxylase [Ascodesmis nigricans]